MMAGWAGLFAILSSGTVQPGCQLPEVVMEMKLEGTGKLLLEECLGNRDATITMAANALTIVQGTMQLEVPLLEDEGKKRGICNSKNIGCRFSSRENAESGSSTPRSPKQIP